MSDGQGLLVSPPEATAFSNNLLRLLENLRAANEVSNKLPQLSLMLEQCFVPLYRLSLIHNVPFIDAIRVAVEAALNDVASAVKARLHHGTTALDNIRPADVHRERLLSAEPDGRAKSDCIHRCKADIRAFDLDTVPPRYRSADKTLSALRFEADMLEFQRPGLSTAARIWLYQYGLFRMMQVAKMLSERLGKRDVRLLGEVVAGDQTRARRRRREWKWVLWGYAMRAAKRRDN